MTKITAGRWTLNARDFIKGLVVSVISTAAPVIMDSINAGNFEFNWKHVWQVAAGAGFAYLIKNFLTASQVVITDKVTVQAAKDGETITVTPKP